MLITHGKVDTEAIPQAAVSIPSMVLQASRQVARETNLVKRSTPIECVDAGLSLYHFPNDFRVRIEHFAGHVFEVFYDKASPTRD